MEGARVREASRSVCRGGWSFEELTLSFQGPGRHRRPSVSAHQSVAGSRIVTVWKSGEPDRNRLRAITDCAARAEKAARLHDLAAVISRVRVPVVIVRGKHDLLSTAEWTDRLAELSRGEARTLETGAHMPIVTNGPEVAALIERAAHLPEPE